jgi:hypothetical protein
VEESFVEESVAAAVAVKEKAEVQGNKFYS